MGLRVSIKEAESKGWIDQSTAQTMRKQSRQKASPIRTQDCPPPVCPIDGIDPQSLLWRALLARYPHSACDGDLCWEAAGLVPNRKFRVDMAWFRPSIAIEVDGYQYHGMIKSGFHRDREKDRLLIRAGWQPLRYAARDINRSLEGVVDEIVFIAKKNAPELAES